MKTILVGVDGSPRAPGVMAAAVDLAKRTGAKLLLVRAIGIPAAIPVEAYSVSPNALGDLLRQDAEKYLNGIPCDPPELIAARLVQVGTAWQAICDCAKSNDVDLIVIGSHGYDAVDRLLGTTAAKVVNHADRSVLVVRPRPGTSG